MVGGEAIKGAFFNSSSVKVVIEQSSPEKPSSQMQHALFSQNRSQSFPSHTVFWERETRERKRGDGEIYLHKSIHGSIWFCRRSKFHFHRTFPPRIPFCIPRVFRNFPSVYRLKASHMFPNKRGSPLSLVIARLASIPPLRWKGRNGLRE